MMQQSFAPAGGPRGMTPLEAALRDPPVRDFLLRYARHKAGQVDRAMDLVQETVLVALRRDGEGTGWRQAPPPVESFLGSVMNGQHSNWMTREKRQRRRTVDTETDAVPDETLNVEEARIAREEDEEREQRGQGFMAQLVACFAGKKNGDLPLAIIESMQESPRPTRAALAERFGCTVTEVDRARERITHHAKRIREGRPGQGEAS